MESSNPKNNKSVEPMTFSASTEDIKKLVENAKPSIDNSLSFTIAPEACLDKFDEYFKCLICLQTVQKP